MAQRGARAWQAGFNPSMEKEHCPALCIVLMSVAEQRVVTVTPHLPISVPFFCVPKTTFLCPLPLWAICFRQSPTPNCRICSVSLRPGQSEPRFLPVILLGSDLELLDIASPQNDLFPCDHRSRLSSSNQSEP